MSSPRHRRAGELHMSTFVIDPDNLTVNPADAEHAAEGKASFNDVEGLAAVAADWPMARLVARTNTLAFMAITPRALMKSRHHPWSLVGQRLRMLRIRPPRDSPYLNPSTNRSRRPLSC